MYTAGLRLALPDILEFTASYRNNPNGDYNSAALLSLDLKAVKGLDLALTGSIDGLQDFDRLGSLSMYESFGYTLDGFSLHLNAAQYFNAGRDSLGNKAADAEGYVPGLWFWFYASYKNLAGGKVVPRLDLNYFIGGVFDGFTWDAGYGDWAFNNNLNYENFSANHIRGLSTVNVRPALFLMFNKRSWIEAGYIINLTLKEGLFGYTMNYTLDQAVYACIRVSL
jgi:hypothetical protein